MELEERIGGALYGFAIGDAMGATTEFMSADEIQSKYKKVEKIIGGGWLNIKAGDITDDTEMSLCVMRVLMRGDYLHFQDAIAREFSKWLDTSPKDVGNQCRKAILYYQKNHCCIPPDEEALGNGSLMRALPCALFNKKESERLNLLQGEVTHPNPTCSNIIKEYTSLIKKILLGKQVDYPVDTLLEPTGYIINTYNNALYWSKEATFEKAVVNAVNHGGDADTIAAITGSLAGAKWGYRAIPTEWIRSLNDTIKIKLDEFVKWLLQNKERG